MRLNPAMLLVIAPIVLGCQKEYSLETNLVPPVTGTGLLIKANLKDALSELNATYEYNSSGLPTRDLYSATATGFTADFNTQVTRDATGKIYQAKLIISSSLSPGNDTLTYEIKRSSNGKVSYVVMKPSDTSNTAGYDSTVYSYNASSKLAGYIVYLVAYGTGQVEPMQSFELTYDGNNVVKSVEYELTGTITNKKLVETITFFYDNKAAARVLTEDEYIAGLNVINNFVPSQNNTTKYSREYADTPDDNVITEYNYAYGASGRPTSAEVTTIRPGIPDSKANLTFTYR